MSAIDIPLAQARAFEVRAGQILYVRQREGGGQVGDLNAWNRYDARERFWASRTALYHGMHVTEGDQLHSTWPGERPMLTIVADTVARRATARGALQHDVSLGRCSRKLRIHRYSSDTPGCQENLASAIAPFDLCPDAVHDALNLFMYTGLDDEDRFYLEESDAREDDSVELRAEIDCLVAIACCPGACTAPRARGLRCEVR